MKSVSKHSLLVGEWGVDFCSGGLLVILAELTENKQMNISWKKITQCPLELTTKAVIIHQKYSVNY